jgi:hypothetical protein
VNTSTPRKETTSTKEHLINAQNDDETATEREQQAESIKSRRS